MENEKKYFAFISYKREDEEWAKWLQHKLEHYKLSSNLNGRPDLPKEIRPVFKDTSELNPGNLPKQIHDALEQSRFLIVICSPRSAKSEWVNHEVETFIGMGGMDKIIPFIIEGRPFSQSPEEECFPDAIRNLPTEQEILGANINEMGRDAAAVKVVSQMFGLKFDELWNRYEREQKRRRRFIVAGISALAVLAVVIAAWIWHQNLEIKAKDWKMMESQSRLVAEKVIANASDDSYLARRIALEILPKDLSCPDRPYTPEAERAIRDANQYHSAIIRVQNDVKDAVFSPDGKEIMVSSYSDSTIRFYDKTGVLLSNCQLASFIATAGQDKKNRDVETRMERVGQIINGDFNTIEFSPDGSSILTSPEWVYSTSSENNNSIIKIWDANTGTELQSLYGHKDRIISAHFSPDGNEVVSASIDKTIRIWSLNKDDNSKVLVNSDARLLSPAFDLKNNIIAANCMDRNSYKETIRVWDLSSGKETLNLEQDNRVGRVAINPNGRQLAFVSCYVLGDTDWMSLNFYDFENNAITNSITDTVEGFEDLAFSPDGKKLVFTTKKHHKIKILDLETGPIVWTIPQPGLYGRLEFSPDGKRILYSYGDVQPCVFDADTGESIFVSSDKSSSFFHYATYSQDGKLIASLADDNIIRIWDAEKGNCLKEIEGHENGVLCVCFSPDGKYVVSGAKDKAIRVWELQSGVCVCTYKGHDASVANVAFTSDGKHIISVSDDSESDDSTIRLWDFPSLQDLIDQTRERFKDCPLTPEERRQYYLE